MPEETPFIIPGYLNVLTFPEPETIDDGFTDVATELASASEAGLESVLVLGLHADGTLYVSGSSGTFPDWLWLVKLGEKFILNQSMPE